MHKELITSPLLISGSTGTIAKIGILFQLSHLKIKVEVKMNSQHYPHFTFDAQLQFINSIISLLMKAPGLCDFFSYIELNLPHWFLCDYKLSSSTLVCQLVLLQLSLRNELYTFQHYQNPVIKKRNIGLFLQGLYFRIFLKKI